jgi:hypothetical protein
LALSTLIAGLGYATGVVRSIAGKLGLWVHIAFAFLLGTLCQTEIGYRAIRSLKTFAIPIRVAAHNQSRASVCRSNTSAR